MRRSGRDSARDDGTYSALRGLQVPGDEEPWTGGGGRGPRSFLTTPMSLVFSSLTHARLSTHLHLSAVAAVSRPSLCIVCPPFIFFPFPLPQPNPTPILLNKTNPSVTSSPSLLSSLTHTDRPVAARRESESERRGETRNTPTPRRRQPTVCPVIRFVSLSTQLSSTAFRSRFVSVC